MTIKTTKSPRATKHRRARKTTKKTATKPRRARKTTKSSGKSRSKSRSQIRKSSRRSSSKTKNPSYKKYLKTEIAKYKVAHPTSSHVDAFKNASFNWQVDRYRAAHPQISYESARKHIAQEHIGMAKREREALKEAGRI